MTDMITFSIKRKHKEALEIIKSWRNNSDVDSFSSMICKAIIHYYHDLQEKKGRQYVPVYNMNNTIALPRLDESVIVDFQKLYAQGEISYDDCVMIFNNICRHKDNLHDLVVQPAVTPNM